jgi:hypothetical protein
MYSLQRSYSKSSDDSSIQYTQLSHYNVATVKVVMIPAYNILVISLQRSYSKSSDDSSIQYTHYNVATVKVVMIPAYNILSYLITT